MDNLLEYTREEITSLADDRLDQASHLGLPTRGPPRAPTRRVDLFQTI